MNSRRELGRTGAFAAAAFNSNFFFEEASQTDHVHNALAETPPIRRNLPPADTHPATVARMEDRENYSANLIRMWRVYRTAKQMCFDRVWPAARAFTSQS
jgi:hypothetical protein